MIMRHYGNPVVLWRWRHEIAQYTRREGGLIQDCFFDVELSPQELDVVLSSGKKNGISFVPIK